MSNSTFTYGIDFTPETIGDLGEFLKMLTNSKYSCKKELLEILQNGCSGIKNQGMASNLLNSLVGYKLIEQDLKATALTYKLINSSQLYSDFAKHILENLDGSKLLYAIESLKEEGLYKVNLETLISRINECFNTNLSETVKYHSTMRIWLQQSGVISSQYNIKYEELEKIVGPRIKSQSTFYLDVLKKLSYNQVCFLRTQVSIYDGTSRYYKGREVAEICSSRFKVFFEYKSLVKKIITPIKELGLIESQCIKAGSTTNVRLSNELTSKAYTRFFEELTPNFINYPSYSFEKACIEILDNSTSKKSDGKALESLCFYLLKFLGLSGIKIRETSFETGLCEVDLSATDYNFTFQKWQLQCKDSESITSDRISREVGVSMITKATNLLFITTGKITDPASFFADKIMKSSNLNIYFIEMDDLQKIRKNPSCIASIINEKSKKILKIKSEPDKIPLNSESE